MTTTIEWTDRVWNPVTGCTKVSQGCKNCYAEGIANRRLPHGGFTDRKFTEVRCHSERLSLPLSWRKPARVFVNSMSDLFHEDVPFEFIDEVFAVMALTPMHTFQILTKRPARMADYMEGLLFPNAAPLAQNLIAAGCKPMTRSHAKVHSAMVARFKSCSSNALNAASAWQEKHYPDGDGFMRRWPLPNVWLGVSVEDQATANERIPLLLQTPAAVRWVSYEPALEPVDFGHWLHKPWCPTHDYAGGFCVQDCGDWRRLNWIVIGGESGPGARPFNVEWARQIVQQCRRSETAVFVKQLGARPYEEGCEIGSVFVGRWPAVLRRVIDRKGKDMSEWPADLRVREFPE